MPGTTSGTDPQVGDTWRDDLDGYLVRVVAINGNGWPQVRANNGRGASWRVNPSWFRRWQLVRRRVGASKGL